MGSGGGGQTTTQGVNTPQMEALQASALPQIQQMMNLNPLSKYAAWSPRQIAGSNPAYDQLFAKSNQPVPGLNGLELLFGGPTASGGGNGMAVPSMEGGTPNGSNYSYGTYSVGGNTTPAPPPSFAAPNIQDIVNQQVAQAVANTNFKPPQHNQVNGTTYTDWYGNPHDLKQVDPYAKSYSLQPDYGSGGSMILDQNGNVVQFIPPMPSYT